MKCEVCKTEISQGAQRCPVCGVEVEESLFDKTVSFFKGFGDSAEDLRVSKETPDMPDVPSTDKPGLSKVESELQDGKKINAIKTYRELFGCGLKEAKDSVEHFESSGDWNGTFHKTQEPSREDAGETPGLDVNQLIELVQSGRKIEAIKIYREVTGEALKESKEAVERLVEGGPR